MSVFKDVPDEVAQKVLSHPDEPIALSYRGVYHVDHLEDTDFFPTFIEEKLHIGTHKNSPMRPIGEASNLGSIGEEDYCVSLSSSKDILLQKIRHYRNMRENVVALAKGPTETKFGRTVAGSSFHIGYYLFDWKGANPYKSFVIDSVVSFSR